MRIASRAPLRIEFGGGGTDIPSYSDRFGGCVLNATINRYVYSTLKPTHNPDLRVFKTESNESVLFKDLKDLAYNGDLDLIKAVIKKMKINYGCEINIRSDSPPDSGLGNGASTAISLIGLFNQLRFENKLTQYQIAELAHNTLKYELDIQGGKQGFYSSCFGGFNYIEFLEGGFTRINKIKISRKDLLDLEKSLLLIYIGKRDFGFESQKVLRNQESFYNSQEKQKTLEKLKQLAAEMKDYLERGDLNSFADKMNQAFETKKILYPDITNPKINDICDLAKKHGAIATRIQGAGNGGHLLAFCDYNKEYSVSKALNERGISCIPFSFTNEGLEVWEGND